MTEGPFTAGMVVTLHVLVYIALIVRVRPRPQRESASPESMSVLPLTSEERVWLAVSQGIMFGFTDAFKLDLRAGVAGDFESRHVKC